MQKNATLKAYIEKVFTFLFLMYKNFLKRPQKRLLTMKMIPVR